MPINVQHNVGKRISRHFGIIDFLAQVWKLNTDNLPDERVFNLPRPIRRLMIRFKQETLRKKDITYGPAPSKLAVAAAKSAWESVGEGTFGLLQEGSGRWDDVVKFEDVQVKWQKVLCVVQIRKAWPRVAEDEAESSVHVRRNISNDEADFATKLMYLLNSNLRSWATGILIQGTQVSFWYADRMGVIVSTRFDCIEQPNLLYLAGLGIGACTRHNLGICSIVSFMIHTENDGEWVETEMDFRRSFIGLPCPTTNSGEITDEDDMIFFGHSPWEDPDVAPWQLVGRGTVVAPVGAACSEAEKWFGAEKNSVLKCAWAAVTAPVEDATVRMIRMRLRQQRPDMLKHVTEIKASFTRNMVELELPRANMFINEDERVLRVQLLERYIPIECVKSVKDFKTCFRDVVEAHHWVYETSGILHRDISAGNVMIRFISGIQRGVLADWDLSKPLTLRDTRIPQRFGTVPFLSVDFAAEWWQGEHFYRHDLEAFMNLLAWFCACYDPSSRRINTDNLATWYNACEDDSWSRRWLAETFDNVMEHAHPDYRTLAEQWVRPLSNYFKDVTGWTYSKLGVLYRLNQGERWGIWAESYYSPQMIAKELKETLGMRDEAIDYEGFMACLKLQPQ
ncbi:hypothetical protein BDY19DRAFT_757960 [Irpex rosettiformis]|uniref:Uncharacterized protein n=1 Tax=Irpex rosettiformis TaxID=378272 RepID=A0ACB8U738_9APHY|nr:hypothetical protein BDY19DRAFT_757960 [Irpex rosettiformis]